MKRLIGALVVLIVISLFLPACHPEEKNDQLHIVVTYSILGSLVKEIVGDDVRVSVSVPNGTDPHEWEPSARDIEDINRADLIIRNGLGLEGGLEKTIAEAERRGVKLFTATDHIDIRYLGVDEGDHHHDHDADDHDYWLGGAPDPHFWTDPLAMKMVIVALTAELNDNFGLDVGDRAEKLTTRLGALDSAISTELASIPEGGRKLVTGHESLGYFARRYDFRLIGAVIPNLTSQAEVSAADIAALKQLIIENRVEVVFTELGTSAAIAATVSRETNARLIEINTHLLPADGSYFSLMTELARTIGEALK